MIKLPDGLQLLTPPGIYDRMTVDRKGRKSPIYRKVWIDRDKYSPIKGIDIHGHEKARPEEARPAGAEAEAGPAFR